MFEKSAEWAGHGRTLPALASGLAETFGPPPAWLTALLDTIPPLAPLSPLALEVAQALRGGRPATPDEHLAALPGLLPGLGPALVAEAQRERAAGALPPGDDTLVQWLATAMPLAERQTPWSEKQFFGLFDVALQPDERARRVEWTAARSAAWQADAALLAAQAGGDGLTAGGRLQAEATRLWAQGRRAEAWVLMDEASRLAGDKARARKAARREAEARAQWLAGDRRRAGAG